jgi:SNF2 family DNA or RNA helicase
MKPKIKLVNGSVIIPNLDITQEFDWLSPHTQHDSFYFHPNPMTWELFKKDFGPIRHMFDIDPNVIKYMSTMDFEFKRPNPPKLKPATLKGITLADHQEEAVRLMIERRKLAVFLGPGTGKTFIMTSYLLTRKPKVALLITPAKVVNQIYNETKDFLEPAGFEITIKDIEDFKPKPDKYNLIITNIEQIANIYLAYDWDTILIDESHNSKGFNNTLQIRLKALTDLTKEVYLFTGTPQDRTKFEIISQLSIFSDAFINPKGKGLFLNRFFLLDDYGTPKDTKANRVKELDQMISSVSYGYRSEDILELPPREDILVKVKVITPLFKQLMKDEVIETELGDIIADSSAAMRMKLKQMLGGFVILDNKQIAHIDSEKPEALRRIVAPLSDGIIYTFFDEEQFIAANVLRKLGKSFVKVNGKTPPKKADERIEMFKKGKTDFLIIQVKSGGTGLNLQRTNNAVYYSLPYSYISFEQSEKRIWRPGQTKPCKFYYILTKGTFEVDNYRILKQTKKGYSIKSFELFMKKENKNETSTT